MTQSKQAEEAVFEEETQASDNYDTSDPVEVVKARKKSQRTRVDRLAFVSAAMTTEEGRAYYYDLLVFCKVFSTPFDDDPHRTSFKCGEQNIGLKILSDIQTAAPDLYVKMIRENKSKNG